MSNLTEKVDTPAAPAREKTGALPKQKLERTRSGADSIIDTVQRNIQSGFGSARTNIQSSLEDARRNVKEGMESASEGLKSGMADARRNLAEGIETARVNIDWGLESMREGISSGLAQAHEAVAGTSGGPPQPRVTREAEFDDGKAALQAEGDEEEDTLNVLTARLERQIKQRGLIKEQAFHVGQQEEGIVSNGKCS
jgi:hypothetical protein